MKNLLGLYVRVRYNDSDYIDLFWKVVFLYFIPALILGDDDTEFVNTAIAIIHKS